MTGEHGSTRSTLGALLLVVGLVAGFAVLPRVVRRPEAGSVGREAPNFELALVANSASPGPAGRTLALTSLRGRAVLLDFWATWCEPCRLEAPILDQLARRWRERGLVVVGVDTDTPDQGDPAAFARSRALSYPIVHDVAGTASRAYGIEELPTLVVVSRTGKIVAVRTGLTDDAEIEGLLERAL